MQRDEYINISIAFIFVFGLFFQCCLFELWTSGVSFFQAIWHPLRLLNVYVPKAAISFFFASFVFLTPRKWWTVIVLVLNAIWILAECFYMQFFDGMLIDAYSVSMAGNLDGFMSSILMCLKWRYIWLLFPIAILSGWLYGSRKNFSPFVSAWVITFSLALCLHAVHACNMKHYMEKYLLQTPTWSHMLNPVKGGYDVGTTAYTHYYSEMHAFIRVAFELISNNEQEVDVNKLSNEMRPYVQSLNTNPTPQTLLIIFLVESLESWAVVPEIMPNICRFIDESKHSLYATKISRQVKRGGSMDGQMLVNTGVLPIENGAACFRFPYNRYPSLSELYNTAAVIVPGGPEVWNQKLISKAMGIDTNYTASFNDAEICSIFESVVEQHDYMMVITASSHSPFRNYSDSSNLVLSDNMPALMRDYLSTLNFTDRYIEHAIDYIQSKEKLCNSTIVITGDHTIFTQSLRSEFQSWCNNNQSYRYLQPSESYCPLIIAGPLCPDNTIVEDVAYQMDIYPTILHTIGCDEFFWSGFGVNLCDTSALTHRPISEKEAFTISNQVIRSNWFNLYENN